MREYVKVYLKGKAHYIKRECLDIVYKENPNIIELKLVQMSDYVIDLNQNSFIKARGDLELIMDAAIRLNRINDVPVEIVVA